MEQFLQRHQDHITGVLEGFDRLLFRGTLLSISYVEGMGRFLGALKVMYKDFKTWAMGLSDQIVAHAKEAAKHAGRPYEYLASSQMRKELRAREIAERDQISQGMVCVFGCVEPCQILTVRGNRAKRLLRLVKELRQCLHIYFYYMDREFGLMHVRLQSWLPFGIQVCLNGRDYLAQRMTRAGIGFEQHDNCFTRIDDLPAAQKMMRELEKKNWPRVLDAFARRINPHLGKRSPLNFYGYYWSIRASEYATDVMFKNDAQLAAIYPSLVDHAMKHFSSQDVLRFLGRRTNARFNGEISSDIQSRKEGMRIKHRVEENSIKMYDKQGSVLRIETTINNVARLRVYRQVRRKGRLIMQWVEMRKGVVDLTRRVDVCRAANGRYLQALGVVGEPSPTRFLFDPVSKPVTRDQRPYRALRPVSPQDAELFKAVLQGQFLLSGFTNRDLRQALYATTVSDPKQSKRQSARITRLVRLLRAHHLVHKVARTRYYRVSDQGQRVMTAALRVRDADVARLAA
jgi:hypothetical protein